MYILAMKLMIANLQTVDPKRLGIEEGTGEDMCIVLRGENRIDLTGGLRVCRDRNGKIS